MALIAVYPGTFDPITNGHVDLANRGCKLFSKVVPKSLPLISTGAVWSAQDAQFVLDEGADFVGVARVAIAHPDWPKFLSDLSYSPQKPPFTANHLLGVDLSPVFVDYMRAWKGFVTDGKQ